MSPEPNVGLPTTAAAVPTYVSNLTGKRWFQTLIAEITVTTALDDMQLCRLEKTPLGLNQVWKHIVLSVKASDQTQNVQHSLVNMV